MHPAMVSPTLVGKDRQSGISRHYILSTWRRSSWLDYLVIERRLNAYLSQVQMPSNNSRVGFMFRVQKHQPAQIKRYCGIRLQVLDRTDDVMFRGVVGLHLLVGI